MSNPYEQHGGPPVPPPKKTTAEHQASHYQGIAFVVACMATMVLGPMAADFTEPYIHTLFVNLYSEETAGFLTEVWKIGMYALVWFIAQAYIYIAVLSIAAWVGTRLLLPAMAIR